MSSRFEEAGRRANRQALKDAHPARPPEAKSKERIKARWLRRSIVAGRASSPRFAWLWQPRVHRHALLASPAAPWAASQRRSCSAVGPAMLASLAASALRLRRAALVRCAPFAGKALAPARCPLGAPLSWAAGACIGHHRSAPSPLPPCSCLPRPAHPAGLGAGRASAWLVGPQSAFTPRQTHGRAIARPAAKKGVPPKTQPAAPKPQQNQPMLESPQVQPAAGAPPGQC